MGELIGAFVPAYLLLRLFLWALRRLRPTERAVLATLAAIAVCTVIAGWGKADGGPPRYGEAFVAYVVPCLVWGVVGYRRTTRTSAAAAT